MYTQFEVRIVEALGLSLNGKVWSMLVIRYSIRSIYLANWYRKWIRCSGSRWIFSFL